MSPRKPVEAELPRARRLEIVRVTRGVPHLRALHERAEGDASFWREAAASYTRKGKKLGFLATGDPPSYESIKKWHFDTEAPIQWHQWMAQTFGVDLVWLLTGKGEMDLGSSALAPGPGLDESSRKLSDALARIRIARHPHGEVRSVFGWFVIDTLSMLSMRWEELQEDELVRILSGLAALFVYPWHVLNYPEVDYAELEGSTRFRTYVLGMRAALEAARPEFPNPPVLLRTLERLASSLGDEVAD